MVKLFNLELKYDEPLDLSYKITTIMHDVDANGIKMDIPQTTFVKALYLTYLHYLESLQASAQLKAITFDTQVEKNAEWEKSF